MRPLPSSTALKVRFMREKHVVDYVQKELSPQAGDWEPKWSTTMVDLRWHATLLQHATVVTQGKNKCLTRYDALDA